MVEQEGRVSNGGVCRWAVPFEGDGLSGMASSGWWARIAVPRGQCIPLPVDWVAELMEMAWVVVVAGHRRLYRVLRRMSVPLRWLRQQRMWVSLVQRWLWRPSVLPDVPGLLGRPGLGGRRASRGLGSLCLLEAGATPTLLAVGVFCGPMEYRLWGRRDVRSSGELVSAVRVGLPGA
jgi:hypothetical protein